MHYVDRRMGLIVVSVKKGRALVIAPQVDTATTEALRYMARTKQRRTYLPYTFPAVAGIHLLTRKDGGLSKPRPGVQRATGPRLLRYGPQPAGLEPTTSRSLVEHANHWTIASPSWTSRTRGARSIRTLRHQKYLVPRF